MATRSSLKGVYGNLLQITCTAAAALHTYLDTVTTTGTNLSAAFGHLVNLSTGADYEVTVATDTAAPNGIILAAELIGTTYYLTIGLFCCKGTTAPALYKPTAIVEMTYDGVTALGNTVKMDGVTNLVEAGGAAGVGYVIQLTATGKTVQVLV